MRSNGLSSKARLVPDEDILCFQILNRYMYEELIFVYTFIWSKLCCNFNVSSTKLTHMLNILDTFSMGVTRAHSKHPLLSQQLLNSNLFISEKNHELTS